MRRLTLSAVLPNYNHARFLPQAIESILNQSRPPDELLILDDASTDNSVEIIAAYAARSSLIRFVRNATNQGVIAAHQRLFELATGDWLYSGAADDDRFPCFFDLAMNMAEQHPTSGLVFGRMVVMDSREQELGEVASSRWQAPVFASPSQYLHEYLDVESPFHSATAATIFRRDALADVGWFQPQLGSFSDTFAARAIALRHGAGYVPERFCSWRKMPGSVSQSISRDARRTLDIVSVAAELMKSEKFRDRFPTDYVAHWKRAARRHVLWNFLLGDDYLPASERPNFLLRNLGRLRRLPELIALACRPSR